MNPFRSQERTPDPVEDWSEVDALERRLLRERDRRRRLSSWLASTWAIVQVGVLAVLITAVIGAVAYGLVDRFQEGADCERRGGEYVRTDRGYQCARLERVP